MSLMSHTVYKNRLVKGEIRLLRLPKDARCNDDRGLELLEPVVLSTSAGSYLTLSYVWGKYDPSLEQVVRIQGCDFGVGKNLREALSCLRECTAFDLPIWVDAICINQRDTHEKNIQVGQMDDVYRLSKHTIIFLGAGVSDEKTGALFAAIDELGQRGQDCEILKLTRADLNSWPSGLAPSKQHIRAGMEAVLRSLDQDKLNICKPSNMAAFVELSNHEWFSRVWVVQELCVSPEYSFMCGRHMVPGERFNAAFLLYQFWVMQRPRGLAATMTRVWPWKVKSAAEQTLAAVRATDGLMLSVRAAMTLGMRRKAAGERLDLASNLLRCFIPSSGDEGVLTLQATVDKDRIYGLKAISADFNELDIPIEYNDNLLTSERLFAIATRAMIEHGHIGLLAYSTGLRPGTTTLPSWCPDYTKPLPRTWAGTREDGLYNAARTYSPASSHANQPRQQFAQKTIAGPDILVLDATFFARIAQTGHPPRPVASEMERHFLNIACVGAVMAAAKRAYPDQAERDRGAWCIPIFDRELNDIGQLVRATDGRARVEHGRLTAWIQGSWTRFFKPAVWPTYWGSLSEGGQIPVPVQLDTGHIGMFEGPAPAEGEQDGGRITAGDEVWVPRGAHVPYVFRPLPSGHYRNLGPVYVYGMMNGEFGGIEPFSKVVLE